MTAPDVAALAAADVLAIALSTGPMHAQTMGECQAEAVPMLAHIEAMGWRITSAPACVCGHPLIRHSEYGCWDCGTAEASTPQHNFSTSWRAWSREHGDEQQAAEDEADARVYRSPEQVDEYVGEAVRAALEGLRAEVVALAMTKTQRGKPYTSAWLLREPLLALIDARLAALDA